MRYAYVGGGGTTTSMLWQHVRHGAGASDDEIVVYERGEELGTGLAFGPGNLDCHLVNMEADTVSIDPDDRTDFVRWMQAREAALCERYPGLDTGAAGFPPRAVVGAYLRERYAQAEASATQAGIRVRRVRAEVVDLEPGADGVLVIASDGRAERADRVVIASGHWEAAFGRACEPLGARLAGEGRGGYFFPWPAQRLRAEIPPGATVAVLGTSLTAIDTAFTLLDEGGSYGTGRNGELCFVPGSGCRTVLLHSRSGLLPKVRSLWPPPDEDAPFLTKADIPALTGGGSRPPALGDVLEAFRRRVEWGAGTAVSADDLRRMLAPLPGGDVSGPVRAALVHDLACARRPTPGWNRLHYAIRNGYSALARLYPLFDEPDRLRFDATFFRAFTCYAGSMPAQNAAKLAALLAAGVLRVRAGLHDVRAREHDGCFQLISRLDDGRETSVRARYLVNAIGQERRLDLDRSPLWRNLVRRGLVSLHASGAARVDYDGSQLVDAAGRRSETLFAVGAMTLGERIGSSALAASAKFGRTVVNRFAGERSVAR